MCANAAKPSPEELEDLILSARYGELNELQEFVKTYGPLALGSHFDENGNGCLHMAAANGNLEVVEYLLSQIEDPNLINMANSPPACNTPLHWAALNNHLLILKVLCSRLSTTQICTLNGRGLSAMSVAMEGLAVKPLETNTIDKNQVEDVNIPIHEQCVNYLVEMMKLGDEEEKVLEPDGQDFLNLKMEKTCLQDNTSPPCLR
ncbi:hypothetical protein BY996DRAFT_6411055 [Phakopsora pachyrhizi]|uniref:Uncharacterized protein n=1 Tax=Phakopsora pachyrhizi TaxID=170000 RepID=A0AAV0AI38_PHAPC|nr:hypothetical protein BY996DRAFT_6411055 [Phakopsora pachyrhizi]CAH7668063.1 hypothetical protein PPACK8108_LOCUS2532 [Phakopsora pachyrhizi]